MRRMFICAAGLAAALILVDQVLADVGRAPQIQVDRARKGDRLRAPAPDPTTTIIPKKPETPDFALPQGCEAAVSSLVKSVRNAPAVLCVADREGPGPAFV